MKAIRNELNNFNKVCLLLSLLCVACLPVSAQEGIENLRETGKAFATVARQVSPSVAYIQVESKTTAAQVTPFPFNEQWPFGDEFFRRFFGEPAPGMPRQTPPGNEQRIIGQGSGFVFAMEDGLLSDKTYIITNNHVIDGAEVIRVRFQNGREFEAEIVGQDPQSDIAVIEIDADDLPVLPLADSSSLEVGEWVLALGNPFGLSHTLTVGVVSATGRTSLGLTDYEDFIQTDAAINPGNSGGPLVNLNGEVVGINTAIFSRSGGNMGVGFAIPINMARLVADQLIEEGVVTRGYLGVIIQDLTSELAESFDLGRNQGVVVAQVYEDSPAERAGLREGDVIIEFADEPVTEVGRFRNRVSLTPPGSRADMTIIRDGESRSINVTIGQLSDAEVTASGKPVENETLGMNVQTLTPELAQQFGVDVQEGVVVTEVTAGSIAARAGIQPGMVIIQVNRKPVRNTAEFRQALNEAQDDRRILLLARHGETQRFIVLSW